MADIIIKNVPAKIIEKFDKAKEISYQDLISAYEQYERQDYPVDMDIKQFYDMLKAYNGPKTA